jgi:hypothetical protein
LEYSLFSHNNQELERSEIYICEIKCQRYEWINIIDLFLFWDWLVAFMVFNATFNNISVISWRSALWVEETAVHGENHWPAASHWQTPRTGFELKTSVAIGTDCICSCNPTTIRSRPRRPLILKWKYIFQNNYKYW